MRMTPYQHNRDSKVDYKYFLFLSYFPTLTGLELSFVTNMVQSQKTVRIYFSLHFIKYSAYYKIFQINVVRPN